MPGRMSLCTQRCVGDGELRRSLGLDLQLRMRLRSSPYRLCRGPLCDLLALAAPLRLLACESCLTARRNAGSAQACSFLGLCLQLRTGLDLCGSRRGSSLLGGFRALGGLPRCQHGLDRLGLQGITRGCQALGLLRLGAEVCPQLRPRALQLCSAGLRLLRAPGGGGLRLPRARGLSSQPGVRGRELRGSLGLHLQLSTALQLRPQALGRGARSLGGALLGLSELLLQPPHLRVQVGAGSL
mmetsp:Transcript_94510/g.262950  ORF Transcript_94510/g.262950 Transcript_94510/m.262950 type:complete len:241 (-) Transcript_94510:2989-3711(-)